MLASGRYAADDGLVMARDLVFWVGDRVSTWGRLVVNPTGQWLDLARIDNLMLKPPGWTSAWSIRLVGADAARVPTDIGPNRSPGCISVTGTWRGEYIEVETQSPDIPGGEPIPDWTNPPCPPPVGGWPHGAERENPEFDVGDLESSGAIVTQVAFRPSVDQVVIVIAATDIDAVTRHLAPQLPNRLCVVPSRFTCEQLTEVRDVLLAGWRDWRLEKLGIGNADERAQPFASAWPFRVTAEMAEWADTLPDELLRLYPALIPAESTVRA